MALSPTLRQTAPTRNASPPMSDLDVDWAILDEMERDASNTNNINGHNKGKKKDTTTKTSTGASEELTLLGDLQEPTAFPRIFAAPPSLNSKLQLAPEFNAQNIVNPNKGRTVVGAANLRPRPPPPTDDDDEFDGMMDDDVVLGSDDLRMLENAEQEAMAATTSGPQASSKSRTAKTTTTTTATPKSTPKPFPLTEIITIDSDSDSDKNNGMQIDDEDDVDDKENMPVETRHVRRRIAGLNVDRDLDSHMQVRGLVQKRMYLRFRILIDP
ncbi:hypothetical protein H1R20_g14744, partial [Candolleomyces eurysporus]